MSNLLNVKSRIPFIRQPSNESLAETGQGGSGMLMKPLASRPASVASTSSGLRPLSMHSLAPLNPSLDAMVDPPPAYSLRRTLENGCLTAAEAAGNGCRKVAPMAKAMALPLAVTGLTIWCITLTVYVARANKDIGALWELPLCEEMGLVPKTQIVQF